MLRFRQLSLAATFIAVIALFVGSLGIASAHGLTTVGNYEVTIGFLGEPTYQGQPNGLDLTVTNKTTGEKVNGLEKTLNAEIIFGASKKALQIVPQEEVDGAYTASVIPTQAGDYTWHIWGTIEQTPVDVSMTSSPTTFDSVQATADAAFPSVEPSAADLMTRVNIALAVGILGVAVGLAGIIVAVVAMRPRLVKGTEMAASRSVTTAP